MIGLPDKKRSESAAFLLGLDLAADGRIVVIHMAIVIMSCIIAHVITNLVLVIYVLCSEKWYFW